MLLELPLVLPLPVALPLALPFKLPLPVALPLPLTLPLPLVPLRLLVLPSGRDSLVEPLPRTEVSPRVFTSVEQPATTKSPNSPVAISDFTAVFMIHLLFGSSPKNAFLMPANRPLIDFAAIAEKEPPLAAFQKEF